MIAQRQRRLRASWFRRCYRFWLRHEGRILRFLDYTDYRPCAAGGGPIQYIKRITHRRWPRGIHYSLAQSQPKLVAWYAALPADQWVQVGDSDAGSHERTRMNNDSNSQVAVAPGSEVYAHEWSITIRADSLEGAMDAVWEMWLAWQKSAEPIGGICPASMGNRMLYEVKKTRGFMAGFPPTPASDLAAASNATPSATAEDSR